MKKIVLAAALFAAVAFGANAQEYNSSRIGVFGGLTTSSSKIKNIDTKTISLYHLGVAAELPLGGGFAIQPAIAYQVKGTAVGNISDAEWSDFETKVGYIEVPVQLQWGPDLAAFRPYGFLEPFVGYKLTSSDSGLAKTIKDELKKVEYGLGLGVGIDVWKLQFAAKYFWNFGEIYESGDTAIKTIDDYINNGNNFNGISVSVGFFF